MDDLNAPLGLERRPSRTGRRSAHGWIVAGLGLCLVVGLVSFVFVTGERPGSERYALAPIEKIEPPLEQAAEFNQTQPSIPPKDRQVPGTQPQTRTAAAIEASSGVRVMRGSDAPAPGAMVIEIPDSTGVQLVDAPDPRLVEQSKYGLLPRIGADGLKPMSFYARPLPALSRGRIGMPRLALVFGGVGLSAAQTQAAIEKMPEAVTLGFSPYGHDLSDQVKQARYAGHELVLQVPMEAFGDDNAKVAPDTLLTSADEEVNLAHLRTLMARMTGYIGIMNYRGGSFTAKAGALTPVMREVAARGLLMVDDGSSPRSLISEVAGTLSAPSLHADIVVDARPDHSSVETALARLEAQARAHGLAIGVAEGYPATLDQIAEWAKSLEGRGILLVPLSALIGQTPRSVAEQ